jgi:hypothetical protein
MRIELLLTGQKFDIYAVVDNNGDCPCIDFLERLKQEDIASHKSLVSILSAHAQRGPLLNIQKSRPVEGKDNLYEFKSRQGARLLYFFQPGGKTILTNGFKKGAAVKQEFDRSEKMRDQYLRESKNG